MNYKCKYCLLRSTEKLIDRLEIDTSSKEILVNKIFHHISLVNKDMITPESAREINNMIKSEVDLEDLCLEEKKTSNDLALNKYNSLKEIVNCSKNPFVTSLRLMIAGNIMDFAAIPEFFDDSERYFNKTIERVLSADFSIDHSKELEKRLNQSNLTLILGDNAGEIVLDKLFLETNQYPNIYYAVKGMPVMNDVTVKDALQVGINKYSQVISNGYDAPSTILSKCSNEFIEIYQKADLIISKGQGNLEGLLDHTDKRIFFLLMVKCDLIADRLNAKKGDFIVFNRSYV